MKNLVRIAFRNVTVNWRHSLAALLTIAAAFMTQVLFSGYMASVIEAYEVNYRERAMYGDLILENKNLTQPESKQDPFRYYLTEKEQGAIETFLKSSSYLAEEPVRFLTISGMVTNGKSSAVFWGVGYDPKAGAKMRGPLWFWNTIFGNPLQKSEHPFPLLLGQSLAKNMGCEGISAENHFNNIEGYPPVLRPFECQQTQIQLSLLTETGQLNAIDFEVQGIIDGGYRDLDSRYVQTSLSAAQTLLNTSKVSFYTIQLKKSTDLEHFINDFTNSVGSEFPDLIAIPWKQHPAGDMYRKSMELLNIFKIFVVTIILSISFLSTLNSMIKIVKERIREIGTLRSLGFVRRQILFIFSLEAFFLSVLGSGVGVLFTLLSIFVINRAKIEYKAGMMSEPTLFQIQIQPGHFLLSFFVLASLSVITAFLASRAPTHSAVAQNLAHV